MTNFPFSGTTPVTSNKPSVDQPTMTQNNASILGWSAVDHVGYNANNGGLHNQVTFLPNQSAPSLNGGVAGLYVNLVSSLSELFFQNSTQNFQLTGLNIVGSGGNFGVTTPWGLIFNFGFINVNTSSLNNAYAVPFTSNAYTILTSANSTKASFTSSGTFGTNPLTQFNLYNLGNYAVFYLAIGK